MTTAAPARLWNMDEPVFGPDGAVIRGGMFAYQRAWWNLPNFVRVCVAGLGAGKTLLGCKRIIASALANAPVPVAAVSPNFPLARRTIIPTLKDLLAGKSRLLGEDVFHWRYHQSYHEFFIYHNGRTGLIYVLSGEEPENLRGPNLGAAFIDEPFIQSVEVWKQIVARVRHPGAPRREIALCGTPEGTINWGYDLCRGTLREKNDVGIIQASTRDNLATGATYVKQLEGVFGEREALAYIEGNLISLSTGLVYYGASDRNFISLEMPQGAELGCGMDFNVNPMAFSVFWRWREHMHFFAEFELPNADTEYACSLLREKYVDTPAVKAGQAPPLQTVYPDPSGNTRHTNAPAGKTDFHYIRAAGFEISAPHAHPRVRDTEVAVNGKLAPKAGNPTLTVDPKTCPKLVKYLSTYAHEDRNKDEQKRMSHLLDGLRYSVHRLFPVTVGATAGRMVGT